MRRKYIIMDKDISTDNSDPAFPNWTFRWCLKIDTVTEVKQSEATSFKTEDDARTWLFKNQKRVRGGWNQWMVKEI